MIDERDEGEDDVLRARLRQALVSRPTPAAWVASAMAIPAREPLVSERRFVMILPQLTGTALLVALVVMVCLARSALEPFVAPVPAGLVAMALLPALTGLLAVEGARGFPNLRRWFA